MISSAASIGPPTAFHVGVALKVIEAVRRLPKDEQPQQLAETTRHIDQPERRATLDRRHVGLNELAQQEAVHVRHLAHVEENRRLAAFNRRDEPVAKPGGRVALGSHVALLVDDEAQVLNLLRHLLVKDGNYHVLTAANGGEALDVSSKYSQGIDILITDMIMPGMTGLELIEKLQNHPSGRPTFTFLITAYDVPGLNVTARRLKVKEVIVKPVHPERIRQVVLEKGYLTAEQLDKILDVRAMTEGGILGTGSSG